MVDDDDIETLLSRGVEKTKELTQTIEKAIPTDEQYFKFDFLKIDS